MPGNMALVSTILLDRAAESVRVYTRVLPEYDRHYELKRRLPKRTLPPLLYRLDAISQSCTASRAQSARTCR